MIASVIDKSPGKALSIRTRTFLVLLAALAIAQAIGLTLMLTRPPIRNAPVPLSLLARWLTEPTRAQGPSSSSSARKEVRAYVSTQLPPVRGDVDVNQSERVKALLAASTGVPVQSLVVRVRRGEVLAPPGPGPQRRPEMILGEGFLVARDLGDGRWQIFESILQGFPNPLHRQVLLLFGLGTAALLPLAWLFATALSSSMRRFAAAAGLVGADPNAPPLPLEGPEEMREAATAFNTMQARIHRLLEERTEMIAAIAHDLRTPLTRLAFRLHDLPPAVDEKVAADIQEMKMMISAALDFSRGRALSTKREPLDFRLLVEAVVGNYADLGHDVKLEPGEPVTVRGDSDGLRRAIANLIDNAIKYGARARTRLRTEGTECVLEIDDDGPGIPEVMQSLAFRPFTRLEGSRNRETGGVGLGLAIVRATILDHGGEVRLQNRDDGGLRVTVVLSAAPATASTSTRALPHESLIRPRRN